MHFEYIVHRYCTEGAGLYAFDPTIIPTPLVSNADREMRWAAIRHNSRITMPQAAKSCITIGSVHNPYNSMYYYILRSMVQLQIAMHSSPRQ